jgi:hypothetical protein
MSNSVLDSNFKLPPFIQNIFKLNERVLGITLLCYLLGFIITNLYLGSLGVVSFDILRTRYVLVGFLFLIYFSIISVLEVISKTVYCLQ